nr:uncharacterized protein LOC109731075 [Microcebus murinus]
MLRETNRKAPGRRAPASALPLCARCLPERSHLPHALRRFYSSTSPTSNPEVRFSLGARSAGESLPCVQQVLDGGRTALWRDQDCDSACRELLVSPSPHNLSVFRLQGPQKSSGGSEKQNVVRVPLVAQEITLSWVTAFLHPPILSEPMSQSEDYCLQIWSYQCIIYVLQEFPGHPKSHPLFWISHFVKPAEKQQQIRRGEAELLEVGPMKVLEGGGAGSSFSTLLVSGCPTTPCL